MLPLSRRLGSPSSRKIFNNSGDLYHGTDSSVIEFWSEFHSHFSLLCTMVVVAVAGGTGGVGRTVLDAIAKSGEHKAIVLSRTVSSSILLC